LAVPRFAARLSATAGAYIVASLAAGLVLSAYGMLISSQPFDSANFAKTGALAIFYAGMVLVMAALPSALLIILAEFFSWRPLWLHLAIGAALGAGFERLVDQGNPLDYGTIAAFVAAGLLASLVYWAIAGRKAGLRAPFPS
jgi:hypothetical protein